MRDRKRKIKIYFNLIGVLLWVALILEPERVKEFWVPLSKSPDTLTKVFALVIGALLLTPPLTLYSMARSPLPWRRWRRGWRRRGASKRAIVLLAGLLLIAGFLVARPNAQNLTLTVSNAVGLPASTSNEIADFPPAVTQWEGLMQAAANKHGVSLRDMATLVMIETGGDPNLPGGSGEVGLVQLMPYHINKAPPGASLWDPATNLMVGAQILAYWKSQWPNQRQAWYAAYNGGGLAGHWWAGEASRSDYVAAQGETKAGYVETYVSRAMAWWK